MALFLEEAGLAYELVPVDTRKGEQHQPAFLAINPNGKTPAIVDGDATVFDSNAILLYLAEKTGKFLPREHAEGARRAPLLADVRRDRQSAPIPGRPCTSSTSRLSPRSTRSTATCTRRGATGASSTRTWRAGATWWATPTPSSTWRCGAGRAGIPFVLGEEAWARMPNLKRLFDEISARPAAERANALKDRHAFKTEMDEEARRHMFPQNASLAAA